MGWHYAVGLNRWLQQLVCSTCFAHRLVWSPGGGLRFMCWVNESMSSLCRSGSVVIILTLTASSCPVHARGLQVGLIN